MTRLRLRLWAMATGGSKDRTSSGTDQVGVVEVVDGWRGPVQQGKACKGGFMARSAPLGFELNFVQESSVRVFYL
jgi:hypothetical protein